MILAYHVIFACYGFWLPNDPRGSWSDFVASWELLRAGGPATKTTARRSLAHDPHDRAERLATKRALKHPPVELDGRQALAASRGFRAAVAEAGYICHACAVLPDHAHLVIARHARPPRRIVGHLKASASRSLSAAGLHPFAEGTGSDGGRHTPWVEGCWVVYLDTADAVARAVGYVEGNPAKEGKPPQAWSFVRPYPASPDAPRERGG